MMKGFFRRRESPNLPKMIRHFKRSFVNRWSMILEFLRFWSGQLRRQEVIARMRKGDIVLASPKTLSLSLPALLYRLILSSRYVHSMLYIGDGKVIHTTARHGVVVAKVPKKIYKKDRYAIFRVGTLSSEKRKKLVVEALKWKNKKLDQIGLITNVPTRLLGLERVLLSCERNRIWCSKLIYEVFSAAGIELVPPAKAGVITSEDLAHIPFVMRVSY
jgi:hypothetical protein